MTSKARNRRLLKAVLGCCLALCVAAAARAQAPMPGGRGPGGPPMGRGPMGGPPNMGGASGQPGNPGTGAGANVPSVSATKNHSGVTSGVKLGPSGRWWDDRAARQQVGITHDQQRRMDTIFEANKQAIISTYQEYEKQKANLDALSANPKVDQSKLFVAIDATNQAKTALQKARTQMLLQIRQQLGSEQITKLDTLP
jgi:Spy/CpxP family protein refolding chaperone